MTGPLLLIDSAGLWFRSYFALPESLTAPNGTPVNAVRGLCDMLAKLITDRRPGRLVACLDNDWRPQFRVEALPSYKTHRVAAPETSPADSGLAALGPLAEAVPDTLSPQIPVILELLDALGITTAEAVGLEADDVIGSLATRERRDSVEVITGDRDLFQLVRDEPTPVRVVYVGGGLSKAQDYGPAELAERYDLPAGRAGAAYAEMAVLRGDPSDGLPGVAGIGEKIAAKLIRDFGSLADLLEAVEVADARLTPRIRTKLADAADYLQAAPNVVHVVHDAEVTVDRAEDTVSAVANPGRVRELQRLWGLGGPLDRLVRSLDDRAASAPV